MDADSLVTFVLEQTAKKSWDSETVLRVGVDVATGGAASGAALAAPREWQPSL